MRSDSQIEKGSIGLGERSFGVDLMVIFIQRRIRNEQLLAIKRVLRSTCT